MKREANYRNDELLLYARVHYVLALSKSLQAYSYAQEMRYVSDSSLHRILRPEYEVLRTCTTVAGVPRAGVNRGGTECGEPA